MPLADSRSKSSSSTMVLRYSTTTSTGRRRLPSGSHFCSTDAKLKSSSMSATIVSRISGRKTLTTTSSLFAFNFAACTCAIEADARGASSNSLNNSDRWVRPREVLIISCAASDENGGTLSCSRASSLAIAGWSKSLRVDSIWPNLIKTGPRLCSASVMRSPAVLSLCLLRIQKML